MSADLETKLRDYFRELNNPKPEKVETPVNELARIMAAGKTAEIEAQRDALSNYYRERANK